MLNRASQALHNTRSAWQSKDAAACEGPPRDVKNLALVSEASRAKVVGLSVYKCRVGGYLCHHSSLPCLYSCYQHNSCPNSPRQPLLFQHGLHFQHGLLFQTLQLQQLFFCVQALFFNTFSSRMDLPENWALWGGRFFDGAGYKLIFQGRTTPNIKSVWRH